jgi:sugar (pentulose or hexulose) kinase
MAHCNNCTSDIDAWVALLADAAKVLGAEVDKNELYGKLFRAALEGDPDCGGIVAFNYLAGEHLTKTEVGRPMVVRVPGAKMNTANFMRAQLNAAISTLAYGMQMLKDKEQVESDMLLGHGGFFKTPGVGQQILANALNVPISVMETAGEGGPWGMALLAAYMARKEEGETMEAYLKNKVFADAKSVSVDPDPVGVEGFKTYLARYKAGLAAEKAAAAMQ